MTGEIGDARRGVRQPLFAKESFQYPVEARGLGVSGLGDVLYLAGGRATPGWRPFYTHT